jgi:predicted nucleic acid-binding protein
VSVFVLDASYTLTWCFLDRATPNTDATLRRLEAALDSAIVPVIWQIEVANALGKGVVRRKLSATRAREIWEELALLPIRQGASPLEVPVLLELAVHHNLSVYDACYLQEARRERLPLATNDRDLRQAAESYGITVMTP